MLSVIAVFAISAGILLAAQSGCIGATLAGTDGSYDTPDTGLSEHAPVQAVTAWEGMTNLSAACQIADTFADMLFTGVLDTAYAVHGVLSLTAVGNIDNGTSTDNLVLDRASDITTFVSGGHTYAAVAAYLDSGVQILNVTNPSNITAAGSITDNLKLRGASGITTFVSGGHTYAAVAAYSSDGVQILDVTDPPNITPVGSITDTDTLELDGASGITTFVSGGHIYAAVAAREDDGVQILNVTDLPHITAAGHITDDGTSTDSLELWDARGITIFESGGHKYAAVAAYEDDGVQILNVTDPTNITAAGSITDTDTLVLDGASGITTFVSGGHTYAAVAAYEDDGVQILNVTDPLRITAVSSITDTRGITGLVLDGAVDITTFTSGDNTYVAVAADRDSGVQILDVTDPLHITAAGNIADIGNNNDDLELYRAQGITTFESGGHIYAAVAAYEDDGVQIIRIDIPPDTTLPADAFVTTWRTTSADESITLPLVGTDITINWGDGSTTAGVSTPVDHTYNATGDYTVQITGGLTWFHLNNAADASKLVSLDQWGTASWASMENAFSGASNMVYHAGDAPDLSGVTDMSNMFDSAAAFDGDLSSWDVSSVTDMNSMFSGASSFNQPLNDWGVSSVTDMNSMFSGASSFNQPLNDWVVSSVTDMSNMFQSASDFNQDLNDWDVSSVTDMNSMFSGARSFNQPLNDWVVSSVTDMSNMFQSASDFNQDLNDWDVSSVTDMNSMFSGASDFNQPLNDWVVSSVTDMHNMFDVARSFNQPLNDWDVSSVASMSNMFHIASDFNQPLNSWNVSSVTDMNGMFHFASSFNQPLNSWNVSSVTDMNGMFHFASSFNQPLNDWDVSSVTDMSNMFRSASSFTQNLGNWYVTLDPDTIADTGIPGVVGTISAQNQPLKNHSPTYVIVDGLDKNHFEIVPGNQLNMISGVSGKAEYSVNVTASGSNVFEDGNNWRLLEITVRGSTNTDSAPPAFVSSMLDMATGSLTITFSEEIDAANVVPASIHMRESGTYTGGVTLTATELVTITDGTVISFALNVTHLGAVAAMTEPELTIDPGAVQDTSGRLIVSTFEASTATFVDAFSVSLQDVTPADITFSNDGAKMFMIGRSGDAVYEYALSTPFDVSTAVFVDTFSVLEQEPGPTGMAFSSDGAKMFVVGNSRDAVHEYALSPPFEASTATFVDAFSVSLQETSPTGMAFSSDGAKMFVVGSSRDAVHEYALSTPFDASTAAFVYTFSVSSRSSNPQGMAFSSDGTKMFVIDNGRDTVIEYEMSTPFDASTAAFVDATSIRSQVDSPTGIAFSSDGAKMFVTGSISDSVHEYDLSSAYPIEVTGTYVSPPPTFVSSILGMATGSLAITFSDEIDAANVVPAKIHVRESGNYTHGVTLTVTELDTAADGIVISFTLNATHFEAVAAMTAPELTIDPGAVRDTYGSLIVGTFEASTASFVDATSISDEEDAPHGIAFSSDGTKMFVIGIVGDDVNEYALSTPFDVSTRTWVDATSISAQEITATGIAFSSDGAKMFVVDDTRDDVNEYELSTPFDASTLTFVDATSISEQETAPTGIAFSSDGTKMFVVGTQGDDVNEYALSTPFDISTRTWVDATFISSQETSPSDIAFSSDGAKMFVVDDTRDDVNEYELSTPFDASTLTFVDATLISAQETAPTGIAFSSDGAKMFVIGYDADNVNEYDLTSVYPIAVAGTYVPPPPTFVSSGLDFTTGNLTITFSEEIDAANVVPAKIHVRESGNYTHGVTLTVTELDTAADGIVISFTLNATHFEAVAAMTAPELTIDPGAVRDTSGSLIVGTFEASTASFVTATSISLQENKPTGITFSSDGARMFVIGLGGNVNEYELSTPFDASTRTFVDATSISSQETFPTGIAFSSDGTKMFVIGDTGDDVNEYELSTSFDASTRTWVDATQISEQETGPTGIAFSSDGAKMFVIGRTGDDVNEYALSTPFDASTASFVDATQISAQETSPRGIAFSSDGTKMFVVGNTGEDVNEYNLSTPFDVSTRTWVDATSISEQETLPTGIAFSSDGTKMFVIGDTGDDVNEYALSSVYPITVTDPTAGAFITTWRTNSANQTITIPVGGSTARYSIDWGDNSPAGTGITGDSTHTYREADSYTVSISGGFEKFHLDDQQPNAGRLISIDQWGDIRWTSMSGAFDGAYNMVYLATDAPDLSLVSDMSYMFAYASSFNGNLSSWDVSKVTNMESMFRGASFFNQPLNDWNVSAVTNMIRMFHTASSFNQTISSWDVSAVTDMHHMFYEASDFNQPLNSWNVSSVRDMYSMFYEATKFNQPLNGWDVSKVTDMSDMFSIASSFNQPLNAWDVSSVTNMDEMFDSATSFNQDLSSWYITPDSAVLITDRSRTLTVMPLSPYIGEQSLGYTVSDARFVMNGRTLSLSSTDTPTADIYDLDITATAVLDEPNTSTHTRTVTITVSDPPAMPFITTWRTDSANQTITIPVGGSTAKYSIDWGDNSPAGTDITGDSTHTYREADSYTVSISGGFERFHLDGLQPNAGRLISIDQWGDIRWTSMRDAFDGASNMVYNATDAPDLSGMTDMSYMFFDASSFDGDLSSWDVSKVTNMESMFRDASSFNQTISSWDVSAVTDMHRMFYEASDFNQPLNDWDVSSVSEMGSMFYQAADFNQPLNAWGVSSVTAMSYMFFGATSFDQPLNAWNVSKVTSMFGMFSAASSFNQPLNAWDVSSVTNMSYMFEGATSFDQPLNAWNVSKVTSMFGMFSAASSFNQPLNAWDVSSVNSMNRMFINTDSFNQPLNSWDVSSVTTMFRMFTHADSFNQPLNDWDVSSVTSMAEMFDSATSFNQDLSSWYITPDSAVLITDRSRTLTVMPLSPYIGEQSLGYTVSDARFVMNGRTLSLSSTDTPTADIYDLDITATAVLDEPNTSTHTRTVTITVSDPPAMPFITTWRTDSANQTITIPVGGSTARYSIDWGDNSPAETDITGDSTYTYREADSYTVSISGGFERFHLDGLQPNAGRLISIDQWGDIRWTSMRDAFDGASNMVYNATDAPDLSGVTDMSYMFFGASSFNGDLSSWDVSKVTNMNRMFFGASSFNQTISSWDVSAVTDMSSMFDSATAFDGDLSSWDVSAVTNMNRMFFGASSFNQTISSWDVSAVTDMHRMFYEASDFNQPLNDWDVSSVSEMGSMFYQAADFNQPLNAWDVSSVTDMSDMFDFATSINQPLNSWDVSSVTDMTGMFSSASSFNQTLNSWDVSSVTDMSYMFFGASSFDQPLNNWNVSSVTDMTGMFEGATSFNQPLNRWNVSSVIGVGMIFMFHNADDFDQNLGNWYVVANATSIARADVPRVVAEISAQNDHLNGHNLTYGIGRDNDYAFFEIVNDNKINMTSVGTKSSYRVNVTASGSNVFESGNNWRLLEIKVTDQTTDTTPPVIKLEGSSLVTITVDETYTEQGAVCEDNVDADKPATVGGDTVDTSTVGQYTVTYDCTDSSNNEATQVSRTVNVQSAPDTDAPVIIITGSANIQLTVDETYTEQGAVCEDNVDADKPATVGGDTVDTSTVGQYTVTYDCTDSSNNEATQVSRTVNVQSAPDTDAPVIIITGSANIQLTVDETYTEQGAVCEDNVDADKPATVGGDTVDTSTVGQYTVTYDCTDSSNNEATQVSRTVNVQSAPDTDAPVIIITGLTNIQLTVDETYTEQGAVCEDNVDADKAATVGGDTVDTSTVGQYTVTYDCTDSSNNEATQVSRTVNVQSAPDTDAPVIIITGSANIQLTVDETYTEQGAVCEDNVDADKPATVGGDTVDTSTVGQYTVTYDCTDSSNNEATQVSRTVNVQSAPDTDAPVIIITGLTNIQLTVDETYTEQGAVCEDNVDADKPATVGGDTVDTSTVGQYTVTYDCTDSSNNEATQVSRTVNVQSAPDTDAPVIIITGLTNIQLTVDETYTEQGAVCEDNVDADKAATVGGDTVDTSTVGQYTVTYDCTDSSNNEATQVSRTVNVQSAPDTDAPVIIITGSANIQLTVDETYTEQGAVCDDDVDADKPATVGGDTVDTSTVGQYTVTYDCTDSSNNEATQVSRTVIVQTAVTPRITLSADAFITTWRTDSANQTITIPVGGSTARYSIDWGDNSPAETDITGDSIHTYREADSYTVSISGGLERFHLDGQQPNAGMLASIEQWGDTRWTTMDAAFDGATNMVYRATDTPDLSGVTDMHRMFGDASFFNGDLSSWDVSKVTDMSDMFIFAYDFNGDLSSWDVSSVTNMNEMFAVATSFNQPLNDWDVSSVTYMSGMFYYAYDFNQPLNSWDVSSVTNMNDMFAVATSFNQPLNDWDVSSVTYMSGMFEDATDFNQPLNSWNVSRVTNMDDMFNFATAFSQNLGEWYVVQDPPVLTANAMFPIRAQNSYLDGLVSTYSIDDTRFVMDGKTLSLNSTNLPPVGMYPLDITAPAVLGEPNAEEEGHTRTLIVTVKGEHRPFITTWTATDSDKSITLPMKGMYSILWGDGSNSTNVSDFQSHTYSTAGNYTVTVLGDGLKSISLYDPNDIPNALQLKSIDQWGDTRWTTMNRAFDGATNMVYRATDAPDLSDVDYTGYMFYGTSSFNGNLSSWDVSSVTHMEYMFASTSSFNGDLSSWDVSSVTDMSGMFFFASVFNHPLNDWDVSSVTEMDDMFYQATDFNQPLNDWDVSSVTDIGGMFSRATNFNQPLNDWNVSSVTDMNDMFAGATSFNQPLNSWNVSKVSRMVEMFANTPSFQQNLGNWYVVANATSIARADVPGVVAEISAQNDYLNDHNPTYGISRDNDYAFFEIVNGNKINMTSVGTKSSYMVNVTASGSNVFEDGNNWRVLAVSVSAALSDNADLGGLTISSGTLSPQFSSSDITYTASVDNSVTQVTVTPTVSDSLATITVNGNTVTSGTGHIVIGLTVGEPNTVTVIVTAQDSTTKTYIITLTRAASLSGNADLGGLTISSGTLSPQFSSSDITYTASVDNSVTQVTVTPTVSDSLATITVNGNTVTSGTGHIVIGLTVGEPNTVTVIVTAQDSTTKTYTITLTRAASLSGNADLGGLTISSGTLSPQFSSSDITYTASVDNSVTQVTVTPTASDSSATITVNGNTVTSGTGHIVIGLTVGEPNTVTVIVTAQDSTTKTYTITLTRAASLSGNADLGGLTISSGTLSPQFSSSDITYTASVDNSVTQVTVTPTASDSSATITVNGNTVTSGTGHIVIGLTVGEPNTVTVIVTAQDSTTKTYTITLTRAALSDNADLGGLTISSGTLSPQFSSSDITYTASVDNSVTQVTVTPTASDSSAAITVNDNTVTSGNGYIVIGLTVGEPNTVTVIVTAQDSTTKTYIITLTRAALSDNADLGGLTISSGTLSPQFSSSDITYTASVDNSVTQVTVTPTVSDSSAAITVNGNTVTSGNGYIVIGLTVDEPNTVTVIVTAQDSTTKTYIITLTRAALSDNADLGGLTISSGTLSPQFSSSDITYTASVDNSVTQVTVTPTASDSSAAITVNGNTVTSGNGYIVIGLTVDEPNTVTVIVTAQDSTTKTYIITLTRAALSGNADLGGLTISSGTLSPQFSSSDITYTASVDNSVTQVTVTPTASDSSAAITVNGNDVTSGNDYIVTGLTVDEPNTVTVIVTAQDSTTKTYIITLTRAALSGNADLGGLTISSGTLSPQFSSSDITYTASVDNSVTQVTVTPTASDSSAAITVNGNDVTSGNDYIVTGLTVDEPNTVTVIVTAQDSTTKTYTITLTRATLSDNADLGGLTISSGTLSPQFSSSDITYTASVDNSVTQVTVTPTVSDSSAAITVNGNDVTSGNGYIVIGLTVDEPNTVTVIVTAQDSTTKTYIITLTRAAALSDNADLGGLTISSGTLSPQFSSSDITYTASVDNSVTQVTVTPTASDSSAAITVNDNDVTSGNDYIVTGLTVDEPNTVTVIVTAQDSTTKTYTITVTVRDVPITVSSAAYNPGNGQLTITFNQDIATVDYSGLHVRSSANPDTGGITLSSVTGADYSGRTITATLDSEQQDQYDALQSPHLVVEDGAVTDTDGDRTTDVPPQPIRDASQKGSSSSSKASIVHINTLAQSRLVDIPPHIAEQVASHDASDPLEPITPDDTFDLPLVINGYGYLLDAYENTLIPQTVTAGDNPVHITFTVYTEKEFAHFILYLNLQGRNTNYADSDTYITYKDDGTTSVTDPHGYIGSATVIVTQEDDQIPEKRTVRITIEFGEEPMGPTNMVAYMWNTDRKALFVKIIDALEVVAVSPESAMQAADLEPDSVLPADPEPVTPDFADDAADPEPVPYDILGPDDYDDTQILQIIRMWSGFESESITDAQLLELLGLDDHQGADIPDWMMTELGVLVAKGTVTVDEFLVALQYVLEHD